MAQRVRNYLVDDITGEELPEDVGRSITFTVDGVNYEIDLNEKHADEFSKALEPYIKHGRRAGVARAPIMLRGANTRRPQTPTDKAQLAAMRDWARENGFPNVPDRGRVSFQIREAYEVAHRQAQAG